MSIEKLKSILFPRIIITSISSLAVCWATQGYAQRPPENNTQAATSSLISVPFSSPPSQPPPQQQMTQPVPVLDLEKQLLDFQRTLLQEAKDHQDFLQTQEDHHQRFLEWCYGIGVGLITVFAGLFATLLAFFNKKSKRDVENAVNTSIKRLTGNAIANAIEELEEEMGKFRSDLEKNKQAAIEQLEHLQHDFKADIHQITTLATALARACALLNLSSSPDPRQNENADQERRDTITSLKKILQNWAPTNRTIVVFIGRLYKMLHDYKPAIVILSDVIEKRVKSGENEKEHAQDHSDILFNKACYLNLLATQIAKNGETEESESLRKDAWKSLSEAVQIWPQNLEEAIKDEDFQKLTGVSRAWDSLKTQFSF